MTDYYCILPENATGAINDTNTWSLTDGGSPASSTPFSTDKMIFVRSCAITGITSGRAGSVFIPEGSEVTLINGGNVDFYTGTSIEIYGTLKLSGAGRYRTVNSQHTIGANGTFRCDTPEVWIGTSINAYPTSIISVSNATNQITILAGPRSNPVIIPALVWDVGIIAMSTLISDGPSEIQFASGVHNFPSWTIHNPRREETSGNLYVTSVANKVNIAGYFTLRQAPAYNIEFSWGNTDVSISGDFTAIETVKDYVWNNKDIILNGIGDQAISTSNSFVSNSRFLSQKESGNLSISGSVSISVEKSNEHGTFTIGMGSTTIA